MAEVTLARARLTPILVKLAKALVEEGYDVNYVSFYRTSQFRIPEEDMRLFKNSFTLAGSRGSNLKDTLMCILKTPLFLLWAARRRGAVIGVSEPNWFVALVFLAFKPFASALIYSPYDITYLRFKDYLRNPLRERIAERFNFRLCDGIMHKGPEDELKLLPEGWGASGKPSLQFLPYCSRDMMVEMDDRYLNNKLSKDGRTHLVYVGGLPDIAFQAFSKITGQGIGLDVYTPEYDGVIQDPKWLSLQENGFFHLRKPLFGRRLTEELGRYDWGLYLFDPDPRYSETYFKTSYGNKVSTYLEAGLPVITYSHLEFVAEVVEENGFGVVVDGVEDMPEAIEALDYQELAHHIRDRRMEFTVSANIGRLTEFIKEVG